MAKRVEEAWAGWKRCGRVSGGFGEESGQKTRRKAFAGVTEKLLWSAKIGEVGRNNIDYEMQNDVA
jgi:hypothetical protein